MVFCFCNKMQPHLDPVMQMRHASCHASQSDCFLVVHFNVSLSLAVRNSASKIVSSAGSMKMQCVELNSMGAFVMTVILLLLCIMSSPFWK